MKAFNVPSDCQISNLGSIYSKYFHTVDTGFFVEVGAYDGRSWTNTGFLADIGWSGIYIEPVREYMDRCKINHKNNDILFEQCAIGTTNDIREIYLAEGLSTLDPTVQKAHETIYKQRIINKQTVEVKSLEYILRKHNVSRYFDLLVVDTEGYESEVFESFDVQWWSPRMIIVELCDVHPSYNRWPETQSKAKSVRTHLLQIGYQTIYLDSINTIFWKEQ